MGIIGHDCDIDIEDCHVFETMRHRKKRYRARRCPQCGYEFISVSSEKYSSEYYSLEQIRSKKGARPQKIIEEVVTISFRGTS